MTTRHRQKLAHLFAPKSQPTITTYGREPLPLTKSGKTLVNPADVLDNTMNEIRPVMHRDASPDDPWLNPVPNSRGQSRSQAIEALLVLIGAAQTNSILGPQLKLDELDVRGFLEDAGLTDKQIEVLMMVGEGWHIVEIARFLGVHRMTAWIHLRNGRRKLIRQVPPIDDFNLLISAPDKYAQAIRASSAPRPGTKPLPSRREIPKVKAYIEARVKPDEYGCWVWQGTRNQSGYGVLPSTYYGVSAHRAAYHIFVQPIPDGLVIDHLCRNRACCNPEHLEAVTQHENTIRAFRPSRWPKNELN